VSVGYSSRYDDALVFAACAHRNQVRKGTPDPGVPYIIHPVHVAAILRAHGFDEDIVVAGLLHDTVEDCGVDTGDITARFGQRVTDLVVAVSERKRDDGGQRRPWRDRKLDQLDHLRSGGPSVAALKCADALHNAQATLGDLDRDGPSVWTRFNAGPADTCWYYRQLVVLCGEHLGDHAIVRELAITVERLETHAGVK
jgi:(p)ppGpp synthase/HD superfamily hydrolase